VVPHMGALGDSRDCLGTRYIVTVGLALTNETDDSDIKVIITEGVPVDATHVIPDLGVSGIVRPLELEHVGGLTGAEVGRAPAAGGQID
jgi:hypothetical protein